MGKGIEMGFFDDVIPSTPEWKRRAINSEPDALFRSDFFNLLPYIYAEYLESGTLEFDNYERFYVTAIKDCNNDLVDNFIRIINYKLAIEEPLGDEISHFFGSRLDIEINSSQKKSGTRTLKIGSGTQGKGKDVALRTKKIILALHIYFLFKNDKSKKSEEYVRPKIEGQFEIEAKTLQLKLSNRKPLSRVQKLYLEELDFLATPDQVSGFLTNDVWEFAEAMWHVSSEQDKPLSMLGLMRAGLIPEMAATPKAVLHSYLEVLFAAPQERSFK